MRTRLVQRSVTLPPFSKAQLNGRFCPAVHDVQHCSFLDQQISYVILHIVLQLRPGERSSTTFLNEYYSFSFLHFDFTHGVYRSINILQNSERAESKACVHTKTGCILHPIWAKPGSDLIWRPPSIAVWTFKDGVHAKKIPCQAVAAAPEKEADKCQKKHNDMTRSESKGPSIKHNYLGMKPFTCRLPHKQNWSALPAGSRSAL